MIELLSGSRHDPMHAVAQVLTGAMPAELQTSVPVWFGMLVTAAECLLRAGLLDHAWLDGMGGSTDAWVRDVPTAKIAHFAAEARALDAAEMGDFALVKRIVLETCLVHQARIRARDDLVTMLCKRSRERDVRRPRGRAKTPLGPTSARSSVSPTRTSKCCAWSSETASGSRPPSRTGSSHPKRKPRRGSTRSWRAT